MTENGTRIIAIAALTIDGKIARHSSQFTDWTSPEDKDALHTILDRSDVVLVGNNTYKTAEVPLSKRNCIVLTRSVKNTERRHNNLLLWNPEGGTKAEDILFGYREAALLGGTKTYTYFLEHQLIDELYITVEPLVFGNGLSLFDRAGDVSTIFQLASVKQLNEKGSVLLHYRALTSPVFSV